MNFLKNHRRLTLLLVSVSLILIPVFLYSCGSWGTPATVNALIDSATLHSWVANGYNNGVPDDFGYTKMVILDSNAGGHTGTTPGHVIGAYLYDHASTVDGTPSVRTNRSSGVDNVKKNAGRKGQMDAIIDRAGIDRRTVVVMTGRNVKDIGLGYFQFRYWGFPKNRLKVMDASNKFMATLYPGDFTSTQLADSSSTYSVCDLRQNRTVDSLRATFAEMLSVAADSDATTVPWDVRSTAEYNGTKNRTDTNFSGRIKTAKFLNWEHMMLTTIGFGDGPFKSKATIIGLLNAAGMYSNQTMYTYCQTASRTGASFIVADAMLNWNVKKWDDSWFSWGSMTDEEGNLTQDSPWRTDCGAAGATACTASPTPATVSEAVSMTASSGGVRAMCSYAAAADRVNENDKQICDTGISLGSDCNGNPY